MTLSAILFQKLFSDINIVIVNGHSILDTIQYLKLNKNILTKRILVSNEVLFTNELCEYKFSKHVVCQKLWPLKGPLVIVVVIITWMRYIW